MVFWVVSKETNEVDGAICLVKQSPKSNNAAKNEVIWLDIKSSLVVESPHDSSFHEVIGTNNINFTKLLITCIKEHGSGY